jgi:hypothetical protein
MTTFLFTRDKIAIKISNLDYDMIYSISVFAQVPEMEYFSKVLYSALLGLDVSHIFACILLLVGLTTTRQGED